MLKTSRCIFSLVLVNICLICGCANDTATATIPGAVISLSPDDRARETEQKMTDDERFAMIFSLMGTNSVIPVRDGRIPEGVPMSAGYVAGASVLNVAGRVTRFF